MTGFHDGFDDGLTSAPNRVSQSRPLTNCGAPPPRPDVVFKLVDEVWWWNLVMKSLFPLWL